MIKKDILIVGSGPSGVSAAFPLVEAGLKVIMIDGGKEAGDQIPDGEYLNNRFKDENQWRYLLGKDYESMSIQRSDNPKFRVPINSFVNSGFYKENSIETKNFQALGSFATGGLSNIWGATVASFTPEEIGLKMEGVDLSENYKKIANRIGISGESNDELSSFFGQGYNIQPPIGLDPVLEEFLSRYKRGSIVTKKNSIKFGKSRNAILTKQLDSRKGCELCGMCMYGCKRRSIYNSIYDLEKLKKFPNFEFKQGYIAQSVHKKNESNHLLVKNIKKNIQESFEVDKVILAAGPFSTIKIILDSLGVYDTPIKFFSNPISIFALLFPGALGRSIEKETYNFGQLAFFMEKPLESFGVLYNFSGIPMWEFLDRTPLSTKNTRRILRYLLPAIRVGNCYFPGKYSDHKLALKKEGILEIEGSYRHQDQLKVISRQLKRTFRNYGAIVLPGSFKETIPGSDAHCGGTSPASLTPKEHETKLNGEVKGLDKVFVVDASSLPSIPTKPYTFTIMANADRIATGMLSSSF